MASVTHLAAANCLGLQLLGKFQLICDGSDVSPRGRKARGMLAFLALSSGHQASREQLATLLWTDRGSEQARASLRQTLAELKAVPQLNGLVRVSRDLVELGRDGLAVDCLEIGRIANGGDLAALAGILAGAGTNLLEDLSDLSPSFDEWLLVERSSQRDAILSASLEAVEADGFQAMKEARTILRSLDRLDPYNEAVARVGMRLDHAAGDVAALHRRYRSLKDRVQTEFGVSLSDETRKLFQELLASGRGERKAAEPARIRPTLDVDLVPTVIVGPLQAYGADQDLQALTAFCSDAVRSALSAIRGVRVLDASSSDVQQLSQWCDDALGLYLLSGSTRQAGNEIRVTLQLSDAANQLVVWSASMRLPGDTGDIIDRIVARAAGAVMPVIDRELEGRLHAEFDEMEDSRALYTRARLLIRQADSLELAQEGARLLEKVIERNPRHLGAHLLLARMYNTDFWQQICGHDVAAYRARSDSYLRVAQALAPGRNDVRIRHAWCLLRNHQWNQARRELDAVLSSLSHDPDLVNECAFAQCHLGDFPLARELLQRAFFLNPFPPSDYHADYAVLLSLDGDAEAAEEHFAVSGENGLQYAAVRIANASRLAQLPRGHSDVIEEFIGRFNRAWRGRCAPDLDDVMDWVGHTLPFNPEKNLELVRSGLRTSLEPCWPAGAGNT